MMTEAEKSWEVKLSKITETPGTDLPLPRSPEEARVVVKKVVITNPGMFKQSNTMVKCWNMT